MRKFKINTVSLVVVLILTLAGGFFIWQRQQPKTAQNISPKTEITVYKSPTCGCCGGYVDYLKKQGFQVKVESVRDTLAIKEKFGIPQNLEACHTSIINGYFVEGHVPVEAIKKLLSEKPEIKGIALPGMPSGAPGMTGPKLGKFEIFQVSGGKISNFLSL